MTPRRRWCRALAAGSLALVSLCDAQGIPRALHVDVTLEGGSRAVDIYRPAGAPLWVAVIAHGFARSRARHVDLDAPTTVRQDTTRRNSARPIHGR